MAPDEEAGIPVGEPPGEPGFRRTLISTTPDAVDERHAAEVDRLLAGGRRGFWAWFLVALVLGAGGAIIAVIWLDRRDDPDLVTAPAPAPVTTVAAAPVEPGGFAATVTFETEHTVAASGPGTLTSVVPAGTLVERGDAVAEIDGRPVVAMYGVEPFTRSLAAGDSGPDVVALEANLVAMGFDPDRRLTVDDRYTAATADAVAAWEQSLDLTRTGTVPLGRVVMIPGPMTTGEPAVTGARVQAGAPLTTGTVHGTEIDIVQPWGGVLSNPLEPGTAISTGDVLHTVGDVPVVAVTGPSEILAPVLDPLASGDVEALESALVFFGHDADGQLTVDGEGGLATLAALGQWQAAVGLPESLDPGTVHLLGVPEGQAVQRVHVDPGAVVDSGVLVYTVGVSNAVVEVVVTEEEASSIAAGDAVAIVLVDGRSLGGIVTDVAAVGGSDGEGSDDSSNVVVTVRPVESSGDLPAGTATVHFDAP